VNDVCQTLTRLERSWESGRVASQGLSVALYGAPNVGKSTLFNALLGHERAIVTTDAGTTGDFLEERCLVQGRLLRLIDMAGVREEAGLVERIGTIVRHVDGIALPAQAPSDCIARGFFVVPSASKRGRLVRLLPKDYARRLGRLSIGPTHQVHARR
jgi:hypothetical protein